MDKIAHVLVHPGFRATQMPELEAAEKEFRDNLASLLKGKESQTILLFDESNDDSFLRKLATEDQTFLTLPGEARLAEVDDASRLEKIVSNYGRFIVHGAFLELCVYDLATRLHDAIMRSSCSGMYTERETEVWTPLGKFEDASIEFGHVLNLRGSYAEIDPRVMAFMGYETYIYN